MNNKLRQFFKFNALGFTILYLATIIFFIAANFLDVNEAYLIKAEISIYLFLTFSLAIFFILLTIEAYTLKTQRGKTFSIIFLLFLGILLFVQFNIISPRFLMLNLMFLVIYVYYRSNGSRLEIPLSYLTIGYFLVGLVGPIALLLVFYGWIKYLKECRYNWDTF